MPWRQTAALPHMHARAHRNCNARAPLATVVTRVQLGGANPVMLLRLHGSQIKLLRAINGARRQISHSLLLIIDLNE